MHACMYVCMFMYVCMYDSLRVAVANIRVVVLARLALRPLRFGPGSRALYWQM